MSTNRYLKQSNVFRRGSAVVKFDEQDKESQDDQEISHYSVIDAAAAIAAERVDSKHQARTRVLLGLASLFGAAFVIAAYSLLETNLTSEFDTKLAQRENSVLWISTLRYELSGLEAKASAMSPRYSDDQAERVISDIHNMAAYLYDGTFEELGADSLNSMGLTRAYVDLVEDLIETVGTFSTLFRNTARYDYLWNLHFGVSTRLKEKHQASFRHWLNVQHATGVLLLSEPNTEFWSENDGVFRSKYETHKRAEEFVAVRFPELRIMWTLLLNNVQGITVSEQSRIREQFKNLGDDDKRNFVFRLLEIISDGLRKAQYSTAIKPTIAMMNEFCQIPVDVATCQFFVSEFNERFSTNDDGSSEAVRFEALSESIGGNFSINAETVSIKFEDSNHYFVLKAYTTKEEIPLHSQKSNLLPLGSISIEDDS